MQFKVFKLGMWRYERIKDGQAVQSGKLDRTIVVDVESIKLITGDGRLSDRFLELRNGKQMVGLLKDSEWDFVIPADGKVIYNDHGE